jgi:CheY-like chemotaxis protein
MAKVLIVEDDRLSQKVMGQVLTNAGHEALFADSTRKAWEKLQEHVLVDLVVLDNQLNQEWGWQFLRRMRACAAFRGLPVVVYTAHTERASIVRYVEHGVQSLNVKPYQAAVILGELQKAVTTGWAAQVMAPPEVMYERLNITHQEYCATLATACRTMEESLTVVRRNLGSNNASIFSSALANIQQQCRAVGIGVIDGLIAEIRRLCADQAVTEAMDSVQTVESLVAMVRQRMLAMMEMTGAVPRASLTASDVSAPRQSKPVEIVPSVGLVREVISQPLWRFGSHLQRLLRHPLVTPVEMDETAKRVAASTVFATVAESLDLLHAIPETNLDRVLSIARATPGFVTTYRQICERLGGTESGASSTDDLAKLISQQGLAKVVTLVVIARVACSLPQNGPLNYRRLFSQSLATSLLAFEIGRFLKLERSFALPSAGLLHDAGRWLFGIGEPGIYALALALTEDGRTTLEQAESALFGVDARTAGRLLLVTAGHSALTQEVASWHHDPAKVAEPEFVIAATVVHLAQTLVHAAASGSAAESKSIHDQLADPDYMAWRLLRERGVSLPFDAPERVDTLAAIAATCTWVANQFLEHPNGEGSLTSLPPALLAG